MPNQFLSPDGDIENYFVTDYWLIDQYIGDQLWVWGNGLVGQLGNGVTASTFTPITTFSGGTNWKQVSINGLSVAAIKTDGTLWTWGGTAASGKLGNASTTNASTPVTTFSGGTNWKQVSCGYRHMAAIKTDGTLWIWGNASNGALGNGDTSSLSATSTPITTFLGGTDWKQVSGGFNFTAAIKTDGTLWTWGDPSFGGLGNSTTAAGSVSTPITTFAGGTDWKRVSCSSTNNTAAIKTDGTLWTWGRNTNGNLGNANIATISTPVTTFSGGKDWDQVICGPLYTTTIKIDGTLWLWGTGVSGRLGNGVTTGTISTPITTFSGGTNWKQVGSFSATASAIKTDGTLWLWGSGALGSLGNGATTDVSTPITTFYGGVDWKQASAYAAVSTGISIDLPLS